MSAVGGSSGSVTRLLLAWRAGDETALARLTPLVHRELQRIARGCMRGERARESFQATALVHEAYLRLVDADQAQHWNSRGHFFAAAAEAMRRILIDRARHKGTRKRGGRRQHLDLEQLSLEGEESHDDLLALDEALSELERHDAQAAQLVKLRYFAGLSHQEAAEALGISRRAADRLWALARAWLFQKLQDE